MKRTWYLTLRPLSLDRKELTPTDHLQIGKFCTKKLEERLREGFRDEKTCILHLKDN